MLSFPMVARVGSVDAASLASGLVEPSEDEGMATIHLFRMSVFNCTKETFYV
jgi:hypothetical protein